MNFITSFINRIRYRKSIKKDESVNIVDGIVKAKKLYKSLSVTVHPDRNPNHRKEAEKLMARIVENKHNYAALLKLKEEAEYILTKS